MFSPIQFVFIAAIVLYLLDSIWEVGSIFNPNRFSKRLADYFIIAGLSIHCAFLIIVSAQSGTLPISTLFESSTFYLSLIVLLSVILKFLYRLQSLTPFVMPIVTGFSIAAVTLVKNDLALTANLKTFWLFAHIIPIFLGYASFTVSFIFSIMYLTMERQLKKKSFGPLFDSLPSLETLDALMWKTITLGFPLLTIGLVSGTVWAKTTNILGLLWYLDPKVLLGSLTWLIYAAILHLRLGASFHGTRVAIVTIVGFVIVIFTFIGPFLMGHKHGYDTGSVILEQEIIAPEAPGMIKVES
ncbi:MAG: cytochrome c biogenesis protein CcsA [Candidatus Scalindua sp.]|jgi:cytochrome c-type biogenesis protein CcsB|nr:cytochrome c biogenesis protein CcsA [Candidatus Scalindua sp.]MDV5166572.1 cytochrome c biogenesis protein CcsA [Candidatus Scalindua sp.]